MDVNLQDASIILESEVLFWTYVCKAACRTILDIFGIVITISAFSFSFQLLQYYNHKGVFRRLAISSEDVTPRLYFTHTLNHIHHLREHFSEINIARCHPRKSTPNAPYTNSSPKCIGPRNKEDMINLLSKWPRVTFMLMLFWLLFQTVLMLTTEMFNFWFKYL